MTACIMKEETHVYERITDDKNVDSMHVLLRQSKAVLLSFHS